MGDNDENKVSNYHDLKNYCKENIKEITNIKELQNCMKLYCDHLAPIEAHKDICNTDGTKVTCGVLLNTLKDIKEKVDNGTIQLQKIPLSYPIPSPNLN